MKQTRTERKTALLRQAEASVNELVDWENAHQRLTLTEIEDIVLKLRKQMGEQMAQSVVDDPAAQSPVPGPKCPDCGREMHAKSRKRRRVESRAGSMRWSGPTTTATLAGAGLFPLDEQLAV